MNQQPGINSQILDWVFVMRKHLEAQCPSISEGSRSKSTPPGVISMRRSSVSALPSVLRRLSYLNMGLSELLSVFLLICTDQVCFGMSHPKPACRYPPSQWCRSLEIAIECKVQKQCMEVNAIRPNQTVPPVSVTMFYDSWCPASRVFMSQQLFPTWMMLQDIMTVTLVPYGNAQELRSAYSAFTCQHREPECRGNAIEACIIHLTGHLAFHIIHCMASAAHVPSAAAPCLQLYAPSVPWSTVESCGKGELGLGLLHTNAVMTRALNPAHRHIPWVTLNGEYTEENEDKAMSSLFHLVCQLYKGVKPPACTGAPVRLDRSFC